jgi:hypothetical protein
MRIRSHSESHLVELEDGSRWQIFPGDLDLTLNWQPETEITVASAEDDLSSHVLVGGSAKVRVIAAGESWPVRKVKTALKEGWSSEEMRWLKSKSWWKLSAPTAFTSVPSTRSKVTASSWPRRIVAKVVIEKKLVAEVEGNKVRLSAIGAVAVTMEE